MALVLKFHKNPWHEGTFCMISNNSGETHNLLTKEIVKTHWLGIQWTLCLRRITGGKVSHVFIEKLVKKRPWFILIAGNDKGAEKLCAWLQGKSWGDLTDLDGSKSLILNSTALSLTWSWTSSKIYIKRQNNKLCIGRASNH